MNDAQTWTVIGGFLAIMVAFAGMVLKIVQIQLSTITIRMDALEIRLVEKIDHIDRDVQRLVEDKFKGI